MFEKMDSETAESAGLRLVNDNTGVEFNDADGDLVHIDGSQSEIVIHDQGSGMALNKEQAFGLGHALTVWAEQAEE